LKILYPFLKSYLELLYLNWAREIIIQNLLQKIIDVNAEKKATELFQYEKVNISKNPLVKKGKDNSNKLNLVHATFSKIVIWKLNEIWKTGFKLENNDICNLTFAVINKLFEYTQTSKEKLSLAQTILWSFTESLLFAKDNFNEKLNQQINKIGFSWYENWVNINIYEKERFDRIENYTELFNNFLWINFQHYVDSKNMKFYSPLIRVLHDGFRFWGSYFSDVSYSSVLFKTDNKEIIKLSDKINGLSNDIRQLKTVSSLKNWWSEYNESHEEFFKLVSNDRKLKGLFEVSKIEQVKKDAWESAVGAFYFNKLKEIVSFTAAYALYVENYQFIYELWHFNQPGDAASVNSGNNLFPETMLEIVNAYVKFDDFNSIREYHLDGHHEIGFYYKQYLALLVLRQYTLLKLYVYQDFLGINNIPNTVEHNDIGNYISNIEDFKRFIGDILKNQNLLNELKIDTEFLFKNKQKPDKILDDLIILMKARKEENEQNAILDINAVRNFKKSVFEIYSKRSFYRKILVNLFDFKTKQYLSETNPESTAFGINEIATKNFLAKGNTESYFGFQERYGNEISYQENNVIRSKLMPILNNKQIKFDEIPGKLKSIDLTDKIIISRNIDFAYEVFQNETEYISKRDVENISEDDPLYDVFSGQYKGCNIYTHYDELGWKGFFIIDKNSSGAITQYSPVKKPLNTDFKEWLFFNIEAYSEDVKLLNETLDNPPIWLKEKGSKEAQEKFLKRQVRIRVAESLIVDYHHFKGYSYYIKMDEKN